MATDVHVLSLPGVDVDDLPTVDVDVLDLPPVAVSSLPDLTITEIGAMGPLTLAGIPSNYTVGITTLPDLNVRGVRRSNSSESSPRSSPPPETSMPARWK